MKQEIFEKLDNGNYRHVILEFEDKRFVIEEPGPRLLGRTEGAEYRIAVRADQYRADHRIIYDPEDFEPRRVVPV